MATKQEQLFASLSKAYADGDALTYATIMRENPLIYNEWYAQALSDGTISGLNTDWNKAVGEAKTLYDQQQQKIWDEATNAAGTHIYGDAAAQANGADNTYVQNADGSVSTLAESQQKAVDDSVSGELNSDLMASQGAEESGGNNTTDWGTWASDTFSTESGLGSLPVVRQTASTAEAAADGDWEAVIGDLVNPKDEINPLNLVEGAADVVDDITEDVPILDSFGDRVGNYARTINGQVSDIYNKDVGGLISDGAGGAANAAQTLAGLDIDDPDNPDGYQFDTDSWLDHGYSAQNVGIGEATQDKIEEIADATEDKIEEIAEALRGSGDGDGDGNGGSSTSSSIFSNADAVNNILTQGTNAALTNYANQTNTALAPITEAKDAYNYKQQLDEYNQDWSNYKQQTADNSAYLETQKDAAQNWETYMNPLTDYLNNQLAKQTSASAGAMLGSSAVQQSINKAIADNTASQYQNAVNTALSESQNNQAIAQQQQSNSNNYLSGAQSTLENNVTPTTDWTAYMQDFADNSLSANENLVNAQAQIASQEPTAWDKITDVLGAGVSLAGILAQIL